MKAMIYVLMLLISLSASAVHAQALPTAPTPLPTDTELELARIDSVTELMSRAKNWYDEGDLRRYTYALERLVKLRPYNGAFMFKLAQAYGERDMKTPAYDLLLRMQAQGLSYDPSTLPEVFEPISKTNAYKYIVEGLQVNANPWGQGKVVATVHSDVELLESLGYDEKAKRFLVGSARTGQVLAVSADGEVSERAKPANPGDWWGVLALAVDNQRNSLWLASTMLPHFSGYRREELGRGVIVRLDLASGKLQERFELPGDGKPHLVGALTVAASGTVYAVDGVSNQLYRIKGGAIEPLVALPESVNLRGIAVDPKERFLYLSDYELGLLAADMNQSKVINLKLDGQNFGGIEYLAWYKDHLIAVQNVNQPKRISRYTLSADGTAVTRVMPLEANKPELVEPTVGALVGDSFYFIANSQRDLYGPDGKLMAGAQPKPREIYEVPADMGMDTLPPAQITRPRTPDQG